MYTQIASQVEPIINNLTVPVVQSKPPKRHEKHALIRLTISLGVGQIETACFVRLQKCRVPRRRARADMRLGRNVYLRESDKV